MGVVHPLSSPDRVHEARGVRTLKRNSPETTDDMNTPQRYVAAFLLLLAGCHDTESAETALQVGGDPVDAESPVGLTECTSDESCPTGGQCTGGAGCEAPWTCQTSNVCSAAPPFFACTCSGTYSFVSAGCPNVRYAYGAPFAPRYLDGYPCPTDEPVVFRHVSLVGEGFERFEGHLVRSYFVDEALGVVEGPSSVFIESGAFEMTWYGLVGESESGGQGSYTLVYWIADADTAACTAETPQFAVPVPEFDGGLGILPTSPADAAPLSSEICR